MFFLHLASGYKSKNKREIVCPTLTSVNRPVGFLEPVPFTFCSRIPNSMKQPSDNYLFYIYLRKKKRAIIKKMTYVYEDTVRCNFLYFLHKNILKFKLKLDSLKMTVFKFVNRSTYLTIFFDIQ